MVVGGLGHLLMLADGAEGPDLAKPVGGERHQLMRVVEQNSPQPPSFREGSRRLPFLRRHFFLRRKKARYIFASCIA